VKPGKKSTTPYTTSVIDGKISRDTKRHAVWGNIYYGDLYEPDNRELAGRLAEKGKQ
jgi:hypothetical protein